MVFERTHVLDGRSFQTVGAVKIKACTTLHVYWWCAKRHHDNCYIQETPQDIIVQCCLLPRIPV